MSRMVYTGTDAAAHLDGQVRDTSSIMVSGCNILILHSHERTTFLYAIR